MSGILLAWHESVSRPLSNRAELHVLGLARFQYALVRAGFTLQKHRGEDVLNSRCRGRKSEIQTDLTGCMSYSCEGMSIM